MVFFIGAASARTAIIDADSLLYSAAFATQSADYTGTVQAESFHHAIYLVKLQIDGILAATDCSDYEFHINGDGNFRFGIAKFAPYKGNRADTAKPVNLPELQMWARHRPETRQVAGMEADDSASISYLQHVEEGKDAILVHQDKDLDQIPGVHYSWRKKQGSTYDVDSLEGHRSFWSQVLTGDTSDNIIGLSDIGPAWAKDILRDAQSYDQLHQRVADFYRADLGRFDGTRRYRENAKLLWMLRAPGAIWDHKWSGL